MSSPELVRDPRAWQRRCREARQAGRRMALVPTMGALHQGHVSLLREARARAGAGGLALATVFVNPAQFGPREDLARYPRDLEGDLARCGSAGVDWVLAPEPADVWRPGHQTWVEPGELAQGLCGTSRPGHFRGVATVVAKLFALTQPHLAIFGEKDWQQLQVVRAMARDLDLDVEVEGMPIVREADGLALSSRNALLSPEERRRALALPRALFAARDRVARGERDAAALPPRRGAPSSPQGAGRLRRGGAPETLAPVARAAPGSRMLVAAFAGATRLIDNLGLP
jgi:pantoate--beta-alanine ligase